MKYIGKLLLEVIILSVVAGIVLFGMLYLFADKIVELLGSL